MSDKQKDYFTHLLTAATILNPLIAPRKPVRVWGVDECPCSKKTKKLRKKRNTRNKISAASKRRNRK